MQAELYEQMSSVEETHWWFVARRQYLESILRKYFERGRQLEFCEIGSGTGGNLPLLSNYALVDAVEMNDEARTMIENKDFKNIRSVSAGHLPDDIGLKGTYDGMFALDVIEHVEDDLAALKCLKTYLNNDGFLVTTVPAYQWLWSKHDEANHHFRRYNKKEYLSLISEAGFNVLYTSYFNTLLFPLAIVSRLLKGLSAKNNADSADAGLDVPPAWINKIFKFIFGLERHLAGKVRMPFGLSIVVVAQHTDRVPERK